MRDLRLTVGDYASPGGGQAPNPCVMGCAHLYLGSLFVFGEGGGGSEGGRVESRLAVSAVLANFRGSTTVDPRSRLTEALEHAGQVLRARSQSATAFQTAWARCIAVLVRRNRLYAARVGDLYLALVRGGDIESVFGESDPAETKQSLLGQPQAVTVQVREAELQLGAGDRFVLSNGALSSAVEESEIGRLASSLVPAVAARRLVEAVDKMARDNPVSVQVVQVGEMPLGAPEPPLPPVLELAERGTKQLPSLALRRPKPRSIAAPPVPAPNYEPVVPSPVRRTTDSSSEIALEYSRHETRPNWVWFAAVALLGAVAFSLSTFFSDDAESLESTALAGPPVVAEDSGVSPARIPLGIDAAEAFWSRVSYKLKSDGSLESGDVERWLGAPAEADSRLREAQAVVGILEGHAQPVALEPDGASIDGDEIADGSPTGDPDGTADRDGPTGDMPVAIEPAAAPAAAVVPSPPSATKPTVEVAWDSKSVPARMRGFERIFSMKDPTRAAAVLKRYIHARHARVDSVFTRLDAYVGIAPAARTKRVLRKLPAAKAGPKTRRWARRTIARLRAK